MEYLCCDVNFFFSEEIIQHTIAPYKRKDQQTYQKMCMFILVSKWCKSFNMFNYIQDKK